MTSKSAQLSIASDEDILHPVHFQRKRAGQKRFHGQSGHELRGSHHGDPRLH